MDRHHQTKQQTQVGATERAGRSITAAERNPLRISTFCMVLVGGCSSP